MARGWIHSTALNCITWIICNLVVNSIGCYLLVYFSLFAIVSLLCVQVVDLVYHVGAYILVFKSSVLYLSFMAIDWKVLFLGWLIVIVVIVEQFRPLISIGHICYICVYVVVKTLKGLYTQDVTNMTSIMIWSDLLFYVDLFFVFVNGL